MMNATLSPETVEEVLSQYEVGGLTAPPRHGGGTANANVTVETLSGKYFLKRRNPKYARREYVVYDHRLMEHLAPFGLGTPLATPTRHGERWLEWGDFVYELYPYQEGETPETVSLAQLTAAGERLAAFHRAGQSFRPPPGKEWPRYQDPARIREGIEAMDAGLRARLCPADYVYLKEQVERLADRFPDSRYHALPKTVVHGDYHPGNLKFCGDAVTGVFDLDWATVQPRVLDLADGVFLFAGLRQTPTDVSDIVSLTQTWTPGPERTRAFMQGYLTRESVSDEEWTVLPLVVRARWIYCRVAGRLKLPEERQMDYVVEGLLDPLRAMDALEGNWLCPDGNPTVEAVR